MLYTILDASLLTPVVFLLRRLGLPIRAVGACVRPRIILDVSISVVGVPTPIHTGLGLMLQPILAILLVSRMHLDSD